MNRVNIDWQIKMDRDRPWMRAADAAARLGVTRATLYAYVSRGLVRSQPAAGAPRARGYARDDIERLRRRTEERRDPDKAAARALQWGLPILESAITLIDGSRLYYRGRDAAALARSHSIAQVAALIWQAEAEPPLDAKHTPHVGAALRGRAPSRRRSGTRFASRAQSTLAAAADAAPPFDGRAASAARCGWRIVHLLTEAATGAPVGSRSIDEALAHAWGVRGRGVDVLRAAIILCADHELNVSSFTARCVASAGSDPYTVVIAGLAALQGPRHGGAAARVEAMLASMRRARPLGGAVAARLRRGEHLEGFGHPLYPSGDPRAALILGLLRECCAASRELAFVLEFARMASAAVSDRPNLDFALAAAARVLRLPAGAPLMLFAIGRSIGWIGHAIEQYATGQLIRPRAKYVGPPPAVP